MVIANLQILNFDSWILHGHELLYSGVCKDKKFFREFRLAKFFRTKLPSARKTERWLWINTFTETHKSGTFSTISSPGSSEGPSPVQGRDEFMAESLMIWDQIRMEHLRFWVFSYVFILQSLCKTCMILKILQFIGFVY